MENVTDRARPTLCSLPPEIRNKIYREVLRYPSSSFDLVDLNAKVKPSTRLSFLLTCRQIWSEAQFLAFSSTVFYFELAWNFNDYIPGPRPLLPKWVYRSYEPFALRNRPILCAVTSICVETPANLRLDFSHIQAMVSFVKALPAIETIYIAAVPPPFPAWFMLEIPALIERLALQCSRLREINITERAKPWSHSWHPHEPYSYFAHDEWFHSTEGPSPLFVNYWTSFRESFAEFISQSQSVDMRSPPKWLVDYNKDDSFVSVYTRAGSNVVRPFAGTQRTMTEIIEGVLAIEKATLEAYAELRLGQRPLTESEDLAVSARILAKLKDRTETKMFMSRGVNRPREVLISCYTHREAAIMSSLSEKLSS